MSKPTMSDHWAHLHIKLDPEVKENWEEYVAEDEEFALSMEKAL